MPVNDLHNNLLGDDSDILQPGIYSFEGFDNHASPDIQGLVWMPKSSWIWAHVILAPIISFIALAQLIVGLLVINYDSIDGNFTFHSHSVFQSYSLCMILYERLLLIYVSF